MAFGDLAQTIKEGNEGPPGYPTNIDISFDTATEDNLIVVCHFTGASNSITPSGYSEAVAVTDGSFSDQMAIYYKISNGTETTVNISGSSGDDHCGIVYEFEGPFAATPLDNNQSTSAGTRTTTSTGTAFTTAVGNSVCVGAISLRDVSSTSGSWANSFTDSGTNTWTGNKIITSGYRVLTSTASINTSDTHSSANSMGCLAAFSGVASVSIIPLIQHHRRMQQG